MESACKRSAEETHEELLLDFFALPGGPVALRFADEETVPSLLEGFDICVDSIWVCLQCRYSSVAVTAVLLSNLHVSARATCKQSGASLTTMLELGKLDVRTMPD